jgi:signal transduction histidine kinase
MMMRLLKVNQYSSLSTAVHRFRVGTRHLLSRLWQIVGAVSVRTKILGIVLALVLLLGGGVTLQVRAILRSTLNYELQNRGVSIARDVAARSVDLLLVRDLYGIHQLLRDTLANNEDVRYAFIINPQGQVVAHTFNEGFPTSLLALHSVAATDRYHLQQVVTDEGIIWDFAVPIFEGRTGTARLGLAEARVQGVVNAVTGQMLFTTLLVALAGIAAASLLTWLLTRPILQLVDTTRRVGQGDLTARAPHWANDEIGALADAFNQMVEQVAASQQAIAEKEAARSRLLAQLINAQEEERRRIARELHDGVGQALTSLMVGLKLLDQECEAALLLNKTADLRQIAKETLDEVRLLSRQLRPSVLDDLGLAAALERYAVEFASRYPGLNVDLHCDLPARLPLPVETTLYRIVQEAMTNAARHSQATTLSVLLTQRHQGRIQTIIEDNGCGFDPELARRSGNSVGLHSMAERTELLGGTLNIESSDEGTTVYVEVSA